MITTPSSPRRGSLALPILLLLSGFCGISYEILYTKMLGNLLGNQFMINATVLLTFLVGIGLGTLYAHRLSRVLWLVEAGIGVYAAGMALAYGSLDRLLYAWIPGLGTSALTCSLVALVLLAVPAFLVGCSVPIFAAYMAAVGRARAFSATYTLYNVGAALTALGMQFVLLRSVGLRAATVTLAVLNVIVAIGLLVLTRRTGLMPSESSERFHFPLNVLTALAMASVASAIFQLMMIKVMEFVLGPFNETFALVLAVVLIGIAVGSWVAGRFRLTFDGALLLALTGLVALLALLLPVLLAYASIYPEVVTTYPWLVTAKFVLTLVLMGLPALGFGATIPALLRDYRNVARESGQLLFCSSMANAFGFLLMAFVLHRHLDYGPLILVVAGATAAAIPVFTGWKRITPFVGLALVLLAALAWRTTWNEMLLYASHTSFHSRQKLERALESRTYADRFKGAQDVFAIVHRDGQSYFFINGYVSIRLDSAAEKIVGISASIYSPRLDDALVLGVGSGATAGTVGKLFERTDAVEINRVILENLHKMKSYNFDVEHQPGVDLIHDDGIHHVKTADRKYSLILNTVTSPLYFSSSKLYTRDFFRSVVDRLTPDGVYTTWLDSRIGDDGVDIILRTLRSTFDECWLTYLKSSYYQLICSNAEIRPHSYADVIEHAGLNEYLASEYDLPLRAVPYGAISANALGLATSSRGDLNTLDYPILEYRMSQLPRSDLRELKSKLAFERDLAAVGETLGERMDWTPGEFLFYVDDRLGEKSTLSRLLQERLVAEFGDPVARDDEYRRAAMRYANEIGTPAAHFDAARRLRQRELYRDALTLLAVVAEKDPDLNNLHYERGRCHAGLREHEQAIEQFELEWDRDEDGKVPPRVASSLIALARFGDALQWLERASEQDVERVEVALLAAQAHEGLRDHARARELYLEVLRLRPADEEAAAAVRRLRE